MAQVRTLDTLVQAVDLGREAFENRRISRKSIERSAAVLQRYQRVLQEYGITSSSDVRVVATTAVREATNRLAFADRIFVATGLNVDPIDEAEVNRITYMGVIPHLQSHPELADGKSLVVEVGGGNTEMLVVRGGNVLNSQSFRLGSMRLIQTLDGIRASAARRRALMESHIRRTLIRIAECIQDDTQIHVVALGGDIRFAVHQLQEDWDGETLAQLPTKSLAKFTDKIFAMDEDAIVKRYGASYHRGRDVGPGPAGLHDAGESFSPCLTSMFATRIFAMVCCTTWRLVEVGPPSFATRSCDPQSRWDRKFDFDESHARNVAELSRKLFDQLHHEHRLDSRHEVILFVAALLHEIGLIVNVRSNHKHALYLIRTQRSVRFIQGRAPAGWIGGPLSPAGCTAASARGLRDVAARGTCDGRKIGGHVCGWRSPWTIRAADAFATLCVCKRTSSW